MEHINFEVTSLHKGDAVESISNFVFAKHIRDDRKECY